MTDLFGYDENNLRDLDEFEEWLRRQMKEAAANESKGKDGCESGAYATAIVVLQETRKNMQALPDSGTFLIQNRHNYVGNNMLFNRKNNCGYCCDIEEAGHYTAEEAEKIYRQAPEKFTIWPLDYLRTKVSTCIDMQDCDHSFSVPCIRTKDIRS